MVWDFLKKLFAAPVDAASLDKSERPAQPASKQPRATGVSSPGHPARSAPAAEPPPTDPTADAAWQAANDARTQFYTREFGPLPDDILKMLDMTGAWPGGGLYVIAADRIAPGAVVHATFGFTNPDMPTTCVLEDVEYRHDELGRPTGATGNLRRKPRAAVAPGLAGYGYELVIVTDGDAGDWPLYLLQWVVGAELRNDVGLLQRVETYDGLTVEDLQVGPEESVHVLIAKARVPLPATIDLPNGHSHLLVMTVITDAEMQWSMEHGRMALLDKLVAAGVGQVSRRGRASAV